MPQKVELKEMTFLELSGFIAKKNDEIKSTEHYSKDSILIHMKNDKPFIAKYKNAEDVENYYIRDLYRFNEKTL